MKMEQWLKVRIYSILQKKHKLKIGKIEDLIAYRLKKEKLIKLKKQSKIDVKNQNTILEFMRMF